MPGYLSVKVDHVQSAWERCTAAGEHPQPESETPSNQELQQARRVAVVHVPQPWPHGVVCRNCHGHFPCAPAQWGYGVLNTLGWELSDLFDLLESVEAGGRP